MKLAKKILVGVIAVSLLACCFAFSTSAEAPTLPREDIRDVLEYRLYDTYLIESYDGLPEGAFEYQPGKFNFVTNASVLASIVKDGGDNALLIQNTNSVAGTGYKYSGKTLTDLLVAAFDFKLGDEGAKNGADFKVSATLSDYALGEIILFSANASDDDNTYFEYSKFNAERRTYGTEVMKDVELKLGTWYSVEVALCPGNETYYVTLKSGETELFSFENEIFASEGVDSLRFYVSDAADAGVTKTYLDNLYVLEGTYARDVVDPENSLADFIIALDAYANSNISVEDKILVADLYTELYGKEGIGYTAPTNIDKFDEVDRIVKGASAYVWQAKAEALIEYAYNILDENATYVDKLAYRENVAKKFYEIFVNLDSFAGMDGEYKDGVTYADAVEAALREYEEAGTVIENIKTHTENFIYIIENDYNAKSKDYGYLQAKYNQLAVLRPLVDTEYNYAKVLETTKYPKASDAVLVYDLLSEKLNAIKTNIDIFMPAVSKMEIKKADGVSAEFPYLTTNFTELYGYYKTAETVFENDTVHPTLDPTTYPGLSTAITTYKTYKAYVEERLAEANSFVAIVKGAESSSYYVTVKAQLEEAALYLDTNVTKSLEDIEGVAEAIELYKTLVAKAATDFENATKYIAAVAEIDVDANYTALKKAVTKALALKASGAITGIDGIREANIKLEGAAAKINQIEAYSNTLIDTVESLLEAETLAERRALIFTANSVKNFAEPLISGVLDALETLEDEILLYDEDVALMNELFGEVVIGAIGTADTVLSTENTVKVTAGIVGAIK